MTDQRELLDIPPAVGVIHLNKTLVRTDGCKRCVLVPWVVHEVIDEEDNDERAPDQRGNPLGSREEEAKGGQ